MLENHCKICLDKKKDCCITGLEKYNVRVFTGIEEIKKIDSFKGFERLNVNKIKINEIEDYQKENADPVWRNIFRIYDEFYFLRRPCLYISKKGCKLDNEKKPFICLIYPIYFNLTEKKIVYEKNTTDYIPCPIKKSYTFESYLKEFKITKEFLQKRLDKYYSQLKAEFPKAFK